jgi:hypothetical protein
MEINNVHFQFVFMLKESSFHKAAAIVVIVIIIIMHLHILYSHHIFVGTFIMQFVVCRIENVQWFGHIKRIDGTRILRRAGHLQENLEQDG